MTARKFIDIGANLTDSMFSGVYNGSQKHPPDLDQVLARSFRIGLEKIIVTAGKSSILFSSNTNTLRL